MFGLQQELSKILINYYLVECGYRSINIVFKFYIPLCYYNTIV